MQQFREVSRTRTIYSTETHTSDILRYHIITPIQLLRKDIMEILFLQPSVKQIFDRT